MEENIPPQISEQQKSSMSNNYNKYIAVAIFVFVLFTGATGYWYLKKNSPQGEVFCTQEAKQCPDGSYVSRTGQNCEFAECLIKKDATDDWKLYRNETYGIELNYDPALKVTDFGNGIAIGNCPNATLNLIKCGDEEIYAIRVYDGYTLKDIFPILGLRLEDLESWCEKISLDTKNGYKCIDSQVQRIYVDGGNAFFEIHYPTDSSVGEKILSTIKFLDSSQAIGFYDRSKWSLTDSKSVDLEGDGQEELILLLKSISSGDKDYLQNDLYFLRTLVIKDNSIVYSFEPRNGTRGPFLINEEIEVQDVTSDGLPEALIYWGDKLTEDSTYTAIHVIHHEARFNRLGNIASSFFYNSQWHNFQWADFGDKLQIATADAIRNTCPTCIDYFKYTLYKWDGSYYSIYRVIDGPKNPTGDPFDEEYIEFIHDGLK